MKGHSGGSNGEKYDSVCEGAKRPNPAFDGEDYWAILRLSDDEHHPSEQRRIP